MEDLLRKFYNEIKSKSKVGEHQQLLEKIEKEIDSFSQGSPSEEEGELCTWKVPVTRMGIGFNNIEVEARSEKEAIELAIDEAGCVSFSDKDAEYTAPDGASKLINA